MNKNTIYYSIFLFTFFFGLIFFGSKCQKESLEQPLKLDTLDNISIPDKENNLTTRAKPDTTYRPVAYGGTLKVYPYTIVPCYNKKTGRRDYQVVMYGDTLLPACKYQQQKQYDKINIADTVLMNPNTKMYICVMEIK